MRALFLGLLFSIAAFGAHDTKPSLHACSEALASRIHARYPVEPQKLVLEEKEIKATDGRALGLSTLNYGNKPIAYSIHGTEKNTLRFDIMVSPHFRILGIYAFLLRNVLEQVPSVTKISTDMTYMLSDNAKHFFEKLSTTANYPDLVENGFLKTLSKEQVQIQRDHIIASVIEMPAYKARKKNGFGKLTKVLLKSGFPDEILLDSILFEVEKGDLNFNEVEIWVKERWAPNLKTGKLDQELYRIDSSGELTLLPLEAAKNFLGEYDEIRSVDLEAVFLLEQSLEGPPPTQ